MGYGHGFCLILHGTDATCAPVGAKAAILNSKACADGGKPDASCSYTFGDYHGKKPLFVKAASKCHHNSCVSPKEGACLGKTEGSACDDYTELHWHGYSKGGFKSNYNWLGHYSGGKCWLSEGGGLACKDPELARKEDLDSATRAPLSI